MSGYLRAFSKALKMLNFCSLFITKHRAEAKTFLILINLPLGSIQSLPSLVSLIFSKTKLNLNIIIKIAIFTS